MALLIFSSVLMVSLSGVLYLVVRALPRIAEEPGGGQGGGLAERWKRSELPEKVDAFLNGFLLKFLRKLKVMVLKLDNALSHHLQKVKPNGDGNKASIDFKEIAGQNKEGDQASI